MKPCDVEGCGKGADHTVNIGTLNFACCNGHLDEIIKIRADYEKAKVELVFTYFMKLRNLLGKV